ncbi:RNA polymerase sigma factor [Virgibacillus byunsanensis]|uniref:RNA polymerase sigma factor n=1 Tax=Virgibacillus byunsanensis TaxID=570945 RepID=A0ABW3LS96_9BACI
MFKKKKQSTQQANYEKIIFDMYYHRVYKTAFFIVKDDYLAQDVLQETFLKVFQRIDSLEDGNKMGAWIGTITTRTAIDFLRKLKRRNDFPVDDVYQDEESFYEENSSVEKIVEDKFLKNLVQQNIRSLEPPEYREVIILKYEYELQDKEIAEALGISIGATKSRVHRARIKLKSVLATQIDAEDGETS